MKLDLEFTEREMAMLGAALAQFRRSTILNHVIGKVDPDRYPKLLDEITELQHQIEIEYRKQGGRPLSKTRTLKDNL